MVQSGRQTFSQGEPWGQFSDLFEILDVATKWSSRPVPREVLSSLEGKAMVFNNPRCPGPIPITLEAATPVHASLPGRQGGADSMTTSTAGPACNFPFDQTRV